MKSTIFFSLCFALSYAVNEPICTSGFTLVNNKCWRLFQTPRSHKDAEKICTSYGGTLFMTRTAIDNRAIGTFVNGAGVDHIWMGIFCVGNSRGLCYYDDQNGSPTTYSNFATGFPNSGVGCCVYYSVAGYPSGQWLNGDCSDQMAFVCELPPTHPDICEQNFNGNCYFRLEEQPFSSAQLECQQLCGNLVSIHSAEENRFVTSMYSQYSYDVVRIGGIATSRDFIVWTDGSTMDYSNLEKYDTSGNCLWLSLINSDYHSKGSWFTGDCAMARHFVCKRPVGTSNCNATPQPPTTPPPTPPPPTCTTGIHMAPGMITSPNYPSTDASTCSYTLVTFGSNKIRLTFPTIIIYPGRDYIYVYDGDSSDSPLIGSRSGNYAGVPQTFTSTGNTMFVKLKKLGGYSGYVGFNATFYSTF